jgi:hypothetical protein
VHERSLVGEGTDPIAIDYGVGGFLEIRLVGLDRTRSVCWNGKEVDHVSAP